MAKLAQFRPAWVSGNAQLRPAWEEPSTFNPAWDDESSILGIGETMKKNVASQSIGAQILALDGTAFTGAVTVYVTGDAGTQAIGSVGSGICTLEGNGFYTYAPAQAETNYDHVAFTFIGTGAIPRTVQVYTSYPQSGDSFALIGTAGAGLTALASAANLATLTGYVDTEVAAIKAVTDNLPNSGTLSSLATAAAVAAVKVDTAAILVDTTEIGVAGAGLTALASAADIATLLTLANSQVSRTGTAQAGASTSITLDSGASALANYYRYDVVVITGGAGEGQARFITAYAATTKVATVAAWVTAPNATSTFAILPNDNRAVTAAAPTAAQNATAVWQSLLASANHSTAASVGKQIKDAIPTVAPGTAGGLLQVGTNKAISFTEGVVISQSVTNQPGLSITGNGTGGDLVAAEIAAIQAKTVNLPAAPAAVSNIPTVGAIADQVWDEILSGHVTAGSAGDALATAGAGGISAAAIRAALGMASANMDTQLSTIDGVVDAIKLSTDNLPSDPADQSLIIAATNGILSVLGTPAGASVSADVAAVKSDTATIITNVAAVKVDTAAILIDTAEIGTAGAGLTTRASAADLATVASYIDTEVAAIKAVTDNLPNSGTLSSLATAAAVAAVKGDTAAILIDTAEIGVAGAGLTALASAANLATLTGYVDTEVAAIKAVTDNLPNGGALTSLATASAVAAVKGDTTAILVDTAEIGVAGAGLTAIDLPDQTMNITGNLSGSVGSVTAPVTVDTTTVLTESYRTVGTEGSIAELLYEIIGHMGESGIVGATKTVRKIDGTTAAETFTLDDATTPTSITRAT